MLQLITEYSNGTEEFQSLVENLDWYIMPFMNPDGYVYSRKTENMWRKSRSGPFQNCDEDREPFGVDINRNWDDNWGGEGMSNTVKPPVSPPTRIRPLPPMTPL